MADGKKEDPLADILGDELGEWDKMFDSLHEPGEFEPDTATDSDHEVGIGDEVGTGDVAGAEVADSDLELAGIPEALGALLGSEGAQEMEESSQTRLMAASVSAEQELARVAESASAFFQEGTASLDALELDEDFYEGIEVGEAIPTPIPEDMPMESVATELAIPADADAHLTPVRGVVVTSEARRSALNPPVVEPLAAAPAPASSLDDGVVEIAIDDAVAMSTGTLLATSEHFEVDAEPDLPPGKFSNALPELDLSRIHVPDRAQADTSDHSEDIADRLVLYEREITLLDEGSAIVAMRMEAGRLAESLGDLDRARRHLDAALVLDPRLTSAHRALRRIERRLGNWEQVLGQLESEIQTAGAMEARALSAYRVDLLMAAGEPDLARVAVGELLDDSPRDTRALLANLELAFVDGREDEIQESLIALTDSLSGSKLCSTMHSVAGTLAAKVGEPSVAVAHFAATDDAATDDFATNDATSNLGAQLAQAALLMASESPTSESTKTLVTSVSEKNSEVGAALVWLLAQRVLAKGKRDEASELLSDAMVTFPDSMLLMDCYLRSISDPQLASASWRTLSALVTTPAWTAHALLQAASFAVGEDESAFKLAEDANDSTLQTAFQRAEFHKCAGRIEEAFLEIRPFADEDELGSWSETPANSTEGAKHPGSAKQGALKTDANSFGTSFLEGEALQSYVLELAQATDDVSVQVQQYRWVMSSTRSQEVATSVKRAEARALTRQQAGAGKDVLEEALECWLSHAEAEPGVATEMALLLAHRLGDAAKTSEVYSLAGQQSQDDERRVQLGIVAACSELLTAPGDAADALSPLMQESPSSRLSELYWLFSLHGDRLVDAAECLESEARRQSSPSQHPLQRSSQRSEQDRCRFRSAYLRVHYDLDPDIATHSLVALQESRPEFDACGDLLEYAAGHSVALDVPLATPDMDRDSAVAAVPRDSLSLEVRRIESLARAGHDAEAAERSCALRDSLPDDGLVQYIFERHCWQARASADLAEYALAQLRVAEENSDDRAKAVACEALARVDSELRGDRESARMFWESASNAQPQRADLQRTLEAQYRGDSEHREEQVALCGRVIACLGVGSERSAYLAWRARLGQGLGHSRSAVHSDYRAALDDDAQCREALFSLEAAASAGEPTEERALLDSEVATYYSEDPRARAAFLVRSAETWRSLGQQESCLSQLKAALQVVPAFAPALSAWRDLALDLELWAELAEACLLEAVSVESVRTRASLCLLAGVTLMDKVEDGPGAILAFRKVLRADPLNREAFVRLRILLAKNEENDELAELFSMRLAAGPDTQERCELLWALANVLRDGLDKPTLALTQFRALLALRPGDKEAAWAVAEIAWQCERWADAAEALMLLARLENDSEKVVTVFSRLGTIYAEHIPEPRWALKSFHKVVTLQPNNLEALGQIIRLGGQCDQPRLALGACEQLIKQEAPTALRIDALVHMAGLLSTNFSDPMNAERALRHALDLDPASDQALDGLVSFYVSQKDLRSARVHVDRVANAMRKRIDESGPAEGAPDGEAYRVLARAMAFKANAGVAECMPVAQVAAGLAVQLGIKNAETIMLSKKVSTGIAGGLASDAYDDILFSHSAPSAARTLFALLGGRLAKHIGRDIRTHGVGRSDRLRKGVDSAAAIVLELADEMGVEDVDIFLSKQNPLALAIEPTSPFSLILGTDLANPERLAELRFFVGRSLKGAAASLSAPLQLGVDKFGVLLVGILRQFLPEFAPLMVDSDAADVEQQRLRRLIPNHLLQELQPYALGLATSDFDNRVIWQALAGACNRAGLICAGDGNSAITGLMRLKGYGTLQKALKDPEIASLARFACSDGHARLWGAMRS